MDTPSLTCSVASADLGEPLAATAPFARGWLLLEHPGPWAAKAFTGSRGLDPATGGEIDRRATAAGFRACLIRRPGREDRPPAGGATVLLAWTEPGACWMRRLTVAGPEDLLALDLSALAGPAEPAIGEPCAEAVLLVCTNGKRDVCCAVRGRPLAAALRAGLGERVWEATHLGGHRFAPTAAVLPQGYVYGRLDAGRAEAVLRAADAGEMTPEGCRGRSAWDRPAQAAELAVRARTGDRADGALRPGRPEPAGEGRWTVPVEHADGRRWVVEVSSRVAGPDRPESCGGPPLPVTVLDARVLAPA